MNDISTAQMLYLKKQKRHKYIVSFSRVLILILFLLLWEFTAHYEIIDSFVFSSPSKIVKCFWSMVLDKSIFFHIGITLYETIFSFLFVIFFSILIAILLWSSQKLSDITEPYLVVLNSLPKSALALLFDCMAWGKSNNHYCLWNVHSHFRKYFKFIYKFCSCGRGRNKTYLHFTRKPISCFNKSCFAKFCSRHYEHDESKYRTLPCGCCNWRISGGKKRIRISYYLLQSGLLKWIGFLCPSFFCIMVMVLLHIYFLHSKAVSKRL